MYKIYFLFIATSLIFSIPIQSQENLCSAEQACFGTSLSPRSYDGEDFVTFLNEAMEMGSILYWSGSIEEIYATDSAPYIVPQIARNSGFVPMVQFQVFDIETGDLIGLESVEQIELLVTQVGIYAETIQPEFLAFGVEVNILNMRNPDGFEAYLTAYDILINAVRETSPDTQIVAILQYEQLMGYRGGLFGGENQFDISGLALIDHFEQADIIGFTTYPGLVFTDPSEIPDDYYAPLLDLTHPIAFTEIGWQSDDNVGSGWDSSEEEQAVFIERFSMLTSDLCPTLYLWSFVYDPITFMPFDSMGLRRDDGTARPAWDLWLDLQEHPRDSCDS